MDEMMRYIFNSLNTTEDKVGTILKALKKQKAINHKNIIFTAAISICVAAQYVDYCRIYKEIRDLKKEIEKLKKTEGDQ